MRQPRLQVAYFIVRLVQFDLVLFDELDKSSVFGEFFFFVAFIALARSESILETQRFFPQQIILQFL
jgi:hypothetical protein